MPEQGTRHYLTYHTNNHTIPSHIFASKLKPFEINHKGPNTCLRGPKHALEVVQD